MNLAAVEEGTESEECAGSKRSSVGPQAPITRVYTGVSSGVLWNKQ